MHFLHLGMNGEYIAQNYFISQHTQRYTKCKVLINNAFKIIQIYLSNSCNQEGPPASKGQINFITHLNFKPMQFTEALIPIAFCAVVFGWIYLHYSTRNKERMALIDKGANATLFNTGASSNGIFGKFATLRLGLFFIGIALGVLMGNILTATTRLEEGVAYISMICLFGGLALVLFYLFAAHLSKKE